MSTNVYIAKKEQQRLRQPHTLFFVCECVKQKVFYNLKALNDNLIENHLFRLRERWKIFFGFFGILLVFFHFLLTFARTCVIILKNKIFNSVQRCRQGFPKECSHPCLQGGGILRNLAGCRVLFFEKFCPVFSFRRAFFGTLYYKF